MFRLLALFRARPVLCGFALAACLGLVALALLAFCPRFLVARTALVLRVTTGQRLEVGSVQWIDTSTLNLFDVSLRGPASDPRFDDPYFTAKRIMIDWTWTKVPFTRRLRMIEMEEPQLTVGLLIAAFTPKHPHSEKEIDPDAPEANPFEIVRRLFYKIRIIRGLVWLDDLAPGMPAVPLSIGADTPLEWSTGSVSRAKDKEEQIQIATANGIRLYAREDQFSPVLDLGRIEIQFTWAGLARKEIAFLSISDPTVYIGPRLFAFADEFKAHMTPPAATTTQAPAASAPAPSAAVAGKEAAAQADPAVPRREWILKDFGLSHLHLNVTAFGEPGLALPFSFNSSSQNISASQLSHLQFKNTLVISAKNFDFPRYGVKLSGLGSDSRVEFNLPPQDNKAQNLVETIKMEEASWKEIAIQEVWTDITFNREGISGNVGGKFYGGYLNGGYHVGFGDGFPWSAGLYMTGSDAGKPIAKLAGEHFGITGPVNAHVTVKAKAREIVSCEGKLDFPRGGQMTIPSVAEVATRLPETWGPASAQRQVVARVLESFENYPFDLGTVELHYGVPTTTAELHLAGPAGKRNFVLNWTQENNANGLVLPDQKPPEISVQIDKPTTQTQKPQTPQKP